MPTEPGFYVIWTGALNFGDTPGVFTNATFVGLLLQLPVSITFADGASDVKFLLETTEVEIFGGKKHPVFWNWKPGEVLPAPVGYIDDVDMTPGKAELHHITVPAAAAPVGKHSLTILVNPEVTAGLKDDFVLKTVMAAETVGAKVGW